MIDRIRKARDEDSGFTLIELLVVVIIIGILAAIAIPVFLSQRERAWESELSSDVRNQAMEVEAAATAEGGDAPAPDSTATPAGFPTGVNDITGDNTTFVTYTDGGSTFCIEFSHADLPTSANSLAYDSANGGLQDIGTSC